MSNSCDNEFISRTTAATMSVGDVMVRTPKALSASATVEELRTMFENRHVRTALLVDGDRFAGIVHRDRLTEDVPGERSARDIADRDIPSTRPGTGVPEALEILDAGEERRLVVLDDDGETLAGLLCLTQDRTGFCRS